MNRYLTINIFVLFILFVMTENSYACIELPWANIYDPNTPYSQTVCKGVDVEFNGSWSEDGTYEIVEWKWEVEKWTGAVYVPYSTFYGEKTYFAFSDPAKYQITLTVKDEEGYESSNSDTCYVYVVEVDSVTASKSYCCPGEQLTVVAVPNPSIYGFPSGYPTWTASVGSFPSGNTGSSVTWEAPTGTGGYATITATCGSSSKSKQVTIAAPTNFHESYREERGNGQLYFEYDWDSTSGNLAHLAGCHVGEKIDYPGPGGYPYYWPSPPWDYVTGNPYAYDISATYGSLMDTHQTGDFITPYQAASFTTTQVYRYCDCDSNYTTLMGPHSISRYVSGGGPWRYSITKCEAYAEIFPIP